VLAHDLRKFALLKRKNVTRKKAEQVCTIYSNVALCCKRTGDYDGAWMLYKAGLVHAKKYLHLIEVAPDNCALANLISNAQCCIGACYNFTPDGKNVDMGVDMQFGPEQVFPWSPQERSQMCMTFIAKPFGATFNTDDIYNDSMGSAPAGR
jgi:hypothetical protein